MPAKESPQTAPRHSAMRTLHVIIPLAACIVLLLMVKTTLDSIAYYTADHFTYALDDAYIHMALAKNLALHGVFGATPYEFTSSSSSPLWTLLLALSYKAFGVHVSTSLVLTIIASIGLLMCADFVMRRLGASILLRVIGLLWICGVTPLMAIIFGGMEHPLQILIDVAFLYVAARLISRAEIAWDRLTYTGLVLAMATTAVRYEGALLIAAAAILLAVRKRWSVSVAIAGAGVLPIVAYGVVSLANGGFFLPNSVLVKSADNLLSRLLTSPAEFVSALTQQIQGQTALYLLLFACIVLLTIERSSGMSRWGLRYVFPLMAVGVSGVHLLFGQTGWFYRYEDYMLVLLAIGVIAQLAALAGRVQAPRGASLAAITLAGLLLLGSVVMGVNRGWNAWVATPRATENVYEQMYQTAHFLKAHPEYESVAIGDLGAVAFYNDDLRILDLEGLAENGEPLATIGRERSTAKDIARRAQEDGCQIAIVFPDYFDLPSDWTEVARWTIENNLVCYGPTVSFLAIPPTDPETLAEQVREYTLQELPDTVGAEGLPIAEDE